MGWIVFTIIMLIAMAATFKLRLNTETFQPVDRFDRPRSRRNINFSGDGVPVVTLGLLGLLVLVTIMCSVNTIERGELGLVKQFGELVGEQSPGLNFKAPYQSVEKVNAKIQKKSIDMSGGDKGSAVSKETQPVYMDLTVNFHVDLTKARQLYSEVGPNYYKNIVEPRAQQAIKAVTVEYLTTEIAPNREKIRIAAAKDLAEEVAKNGIIIDDLLIRNLSFSPQFLEAIERKQVATEDAKAAQEKVKQVQAEANQAREKARGEADAAAINGRALRENPESLMKLYIETIVPGQVMVVPSNGNNIINLPGAAAIGGK